MNKSELESLLKTYKIPFDTWGAGESKTISHLLQELNLEESTLIEGSDGIIRAETGVAIDVFYGKLKLVEAKQVFSDGRERKRNLSTSVGEKIKPGENPLEAAARTMLEELGIVGVAFTNYHFEEKSPVASTSFPGLLTKRSLHFFDTVLSDLQFKSEGYIEKQPDKTNYFVWKPAILPKDSRPVQLK